MAHDGMSPHLSNIGSRLRRSFEARSTSIFCDGAILYRGVNVTNISVSNCLLRVDASDVRANLPHIVLIFSARIYEHRTNEIDEIGDRQ